MQRLRKRLKPLLLAFVIAFVSIAVPYVDITATGMRGDTNRYIIAEAHPAFESPEETLAREYAEWELLTDTLNAPVGMQGFEGAYALGNPDEITEIVVQFITPPSVALELIQERGLQLGLIPPGLARSFASYEEQALSGHAAFNYQLSQIPVPPAGIVPVVFCETHQLFNGVHMRLPAGMVAQIAELPEVFAVTPHILPTPPRGFTDESPFVPYMPGADDVPAPPSPFFINPQLMRGTRDFLQINHIHSELGITGSGVRVAMLDTGINHTHPEFARFLDGTGRIHGWQAHVERGFPHIDSGSHGTLSAGAIIGMAPEIELWSFRKAHSGGHAGFTTVGALEQARNVNAQIIYTWGGGTNPFSAHTVAVTNAVLAGHIVVVAAHNDGPNPYTVLEPSGSPLAISIGAGSAGGQQAGPWASYRGRDTVVGFSGRGPVRQTYHIKPDIIALGVNDWSTSGTSAYNWFSGTSMAGPIATGLVALMVDAFPNAPPWEIKARMMNTGRPMADSVSLAGFAANSVFATGAGFVDPLAALTRNDGAFASVEHLVPLTNQPAAPFQLQHMASLSFGRVARASNESNPMTITVHNPGSGTWTPQISFNGNPGGVSLRVVPLGVNTFTAQMIFPGGASDGYFEGNLTFINGNRRISMPFAARVGAPVPALVSFMAGANGSVSATANGNAISSGASVPTGSEIVFTASPNPNFRVARWTINGALQAGNNSNTLTIDRLAGVVTIMVTFEPALSVTVNGSHADDSGQGYYAVNETVTIRAGEHDDYLFSHWTSTPAIDLADYSAATTTFTMPAEHVAVTAHWVQDNSPAHFMTIVSENATDATPSGYRRQGRTISLNAGTRGNYIFGGWASSPPVDFYDAGSPQTTFTMPTEPVIITAMWIPAYYVTINGGHAGINSGAGVHRAGDTVIISAGTRLHFGFAQWTVSEPGAANVVLANANAPITTFTMPANDVTITASWESTGIYGEPSRTAPWPPMATGAQPTVVGHRTFPGAGNSLWAARTATPGMPGNTNAIVISPTLTAANTPQIFVQVNAMEGNGNGIRAMIEVNISNNELTIRGANSPVGQWQSGSFGAIFDRHFNASADQSRLLINNAGTQYAVFWGPTSGIPSGWVEFDSFAQTFPVTVTGSYAPVTGAGNFDEGRIVAINAGINPTQFFAGWTSSPPVNFANPNSPITTFTMPAEPVTIEAHWGDVPNVNFGDVNGDGVINAADITLLRRYIAAIDKYAFIAATGFIRANADMFGDGIIDYANVELLRRHLAAADPSTVPLGLQQRP